MQTEPSKRDVVVTRVFQAPVEQVWRAFVEPEYVMRWWGPTGFTAPVADMDVREGGRSLVCMRAPAEYGGFDMYNTWTYTRVEPHRRLEYILNFTDKDGTKLDPSQVGIESGVPKDVPHIVTFQPLGEDRTEVTVREVGYTTDQAHDLSKGGLEQCMDKMAAIFNG